jgi:Na+-transporting NADH:ubiquinone oxidoreductase subunit A
MFMKKVINIRKGLNIKMKGDAPLENLPFKSEKFALIPDDFRWVVPKLSVQENDKVKVGTPIFVNKENEQIQFVSPVSGTISKILRGDKRKIEAIEISSDGNFESETIEIPNALNAQNIKEILLKYGLWQTIRALPFNVIANQGTAPKAVFISGFDTAPLAPDFTFLIDSKDISFLQQGIDILKKLTSTTIYLSLYQEKNNEFLEKLNSVEFCYFKGKHPA